MSVFFPLQIGIVKRFNTEQYERSPAFLFLPQIKLLIEWSIKEWRSEKQSTGHIDLQRVDNKP
jgi:hypothetical protein